MASGSTAKSPTKTAPPKENYLASFLLTLVAVVVAVVILRIPALPGTWAQNYDPTGRWWLSTILASLPVIVLLGTLAIFEVKAHWAAIMGLATALLVAIFFFHMPARMAAATAVYGTAYGLFPIGWIVLNVIFMYQLTVDAGRFTCCSTALPASRKIAACNCC